MLTPQQALTLVSFTLGGIPTTESCTLHTVPKTLSRCRVLLFAQERQKEQSGFSERTQVFCTPLPANILHTHTHTHTYNGLDVSPTAAPRLPALWHSLIQAGINWSTCPFSPGPKNENGQLWWQTCSEAQTCKLLFYFFKLKNKIQIWSLTCAKQQLEDQSPRLG